jgi:hypothetical protein
MQENKLLSLLRTFQQSKSEFIVVGGLAAVLNGAPVQTYDVDLVYSRTAENIERLLFVLAAIDAVFRIQPARRLKPTASHLSGSGHLNLITRYGPLDLLATIGQNLAYEDLLPNSSPMNLGENFQINVLHLETLIRIKEQLGGEKDLAVLPILRQTLSESIRKSSRGRTQD